MPHTVYPYCTVYSTSLCFVPFTSHTVARYPSHLYLPIPLRAIHHPPLPSLFVLPAPPPPLGPARPPPRPLLPCCDARMRSLLSSSSARSLSLIRVSCFRRLHGKNLHLGRVKRQFPRWGRKSRQIICVRSASNSARSASRAPSSPLAVASHALITASSCACDQHAHVNPCFLPPHLSLLSRLLHPFVPYLFLSFHPQGVLRSRGLLLCARRCCFPRGLGEKFIRAPCFIRTVALQPFATFAVRPRAKLAPT
eukprot:6203387-Pleurochrysis_carterae.AAC.1